MDHKSPQLVEYFGDQVFSNMFALLDKCPLHISNIFTIFMQSKAEYIQPILKMDKCPLSLYLDCIINIANVYI